MTKREMIKELDALENMAIAFKDKATRLKKELGCVYTPAPKRGKNKPILSEEAKANIIGKRIKNLQLHCHQH